MKPQNRNFTKKFAVLGMLVGSTLVSFTALSAFLRAAANPIVPINPVSQRNQQCPGMTYERMPSSSYRAPQQPSSTYTPAQPLAQPPSTLPDRNIPIDETAPLQPPLPENRANPVTQVAVRNGRFDVRVTNNTNALVTYEVIGHTQRRYLRGGETANLQDIPVPATITFVRQDDGYVEAIPLRDTETGVLNVSLDEDVNPVDDNAGVLRIQSDGQVYLN